MSTGEQQPMIQSINPSLPNFPQYCAKIGECFQTELSVSVPFQEEQVQHNISRQDSFLLFVCILPTTAGLQIQSGISGNQFNESTHVWQLSILNFR